MGVKAGTLGVLFASTNAAKRGAGGARPHAGGATARGAAYIRKLDRQDAAKSKKKKNKRDSGGGGSIFDDATDFGAGLVQGGLELADVPRSYVTSHLADIAGAAESGDLGKIAGSVTKAVNPVNAALGGIGGVAETLGAHGVAKDLTNGSFVSKLHQKDLLEHTGAGTMLERAIKRHPGELGVLNKSLDFHVPGTPLDVGLSGKDVVGGATDVAADPLTYATGGASEIARGGTKAAAKFVAEEGAKRIAKDITKKEALKPVFERATKQAIEARAKKEAAALAKKVSVKGKGVRNLSKEEYKKVFGNTGGLRARVPGTGRVGRALGLADAEKTVGIIPKNVTDLANPLLDKIKGGTQTLLEHTTGRSGVKGELNKALHSGLLSPEDQVKALQVEAIRGKHLARTEAGLHLTPVEGEKIAPNAVKQYLKEVRPSLKGSDHAQVIHEIESGHIESQAAQDVVNHFKRLLDTGNANGVNIAERADYVPRKISQHGLEVLDKETRNGILKTGSFEHARAEEDTLRKIVAKQRNIAPEAVTSAETRQMGEDLAKLKYGDALKKPYYETNLDKLVSDYTHQLNERVGQVGAQNEMVDKGILERVPAKGEKIDKKAIAAHEKQAITLSKKIGKIEGKMREAEAQAQSALPEQQSFDLARPIIEAPRGVATKEKAYQQALDFGIDEASAVHSPERLQAALADAEAAVSNDRRLYNIDVQGGGEGNVGWTYYGHSPEHNSIKLYQQFPEDVKGASVAELKPDAKVLDVERANMPHPSVEGRATPADAGISAAAHFRGQETVDHWLSLSPPELDAELHKIDPTTDWSKYGTVQSKVTARGAKDAKEQGYQAITSGEETMVLDKGAVRTLGKAESLDKAMAAANDVRRHEALQAAATTTDPAGSVAAQLQAASIKQQAQLDQLYKARDVENDLVARLKKPAMQEKARQEFLRSMETLQANPELAGTRDVAEIINSMENVVGSPEKFKKFLKYYDGALNNIKAWQLATPGFHIRNFMGGTFNNFLANVELGAGTQFEIAYRKYVRGTLKGEEKQWMDELVPHLNRGQYGAIETGVGDRATEGLFKKTVGSDNPLLRTSRLAGGGVEFHLRGTLAWDRLANKGRTLDDALSDVVRYHFDYQDLSPFERNVVKRIVPFYAFTRYNTPLQIEMMLQSPGKYSRYFQFQQEAKAPVDKGTVVPSYYQSLFGIPTSSHEGKGQVFLTPDLPFTQTIANAVPDIGQYDSSDPVGSTIFGVMGPYLSQITPLIKTPLELGRGEQVFKGIPLRGKAFFTKDGKAEPNPGWASIPGVMPALKALGVTAQTKQGERVTDTGQYAFEQVFPWSTRWRKVGPTSEKDKSRLSANIASLLGAPVRTNTAYDQRTEMQRRKYAKQGR